MGIFGYVLGGSAIVLGGIGATIIGAYVVEKTGLGAELRGEVEISPYVVLSSDGNFEIREYPTQYLVQTLDSDDSDAFRKLFNYIDGKNDRDEKIPMTAPVYMWQASTQDDEMMAFVMPSSMSADERPNPSDLSVELA